MVDYKKIKLSQCFSTIGPSGLGGHLWPRLWALPGGWPSSQFPAGLLLCCGCPALHAAGPAGDCVRAGSPAAGRTATGGGAVPALASAALTGRPFLPGDGWPSLGSPTPASLSWLPAPASRLRRRCSSSASWRSLWWRWRSSGSEETRIVW